MTSARNMTAELLRVRLAGQLDALQWVVSSAPAERLTRRPQPDKWSAREHVAHLACYQQRFLERLRTILKTHRPEFQRYRAEEDLDWPQWQGLTTKQAHERLNTLRRELVALVASLSDSQLERVGLHPVFGALTIPQWIDFFLFHEAHHVYMVMTLAWRREPSAR